MKSARCLTSISKVLLIAVVSVFQITSVSFSAQTLGFNFDWDDNIFNMPTEIMLWNKKTQEEFGVSTSKWALIRQSVGQPGDWEMFEVIPKGKPHASLRFFGDEIGDGVNHFRSDIVKALKESADKWKGPSWDAFVIAMSHEETAKNTTIITARGHSPSTMLAGLAYLKDQGYLKHLPPKENLFAVMYPEIQPKKYFAEATSPSVAKALVMMDLLDNLAMVPFDAKSSFVTNSDNTGIGIRHLWGFSDDDYGNYETAVRSLSEEIKKDPLRWRRIKITVFFTEKHNPKHQPTAVVLTSKGGTRDLPQRELEEVDKIVSKLSDHSVFRVLYERKNSR